MENETIDLDEEEQKKSPIWSIVSIFLILLLLIWFIPSYSIKLDPRPTNTPTIKDVTFNYEGEVGTIGYYVNHSDVFSKVLASRIISIACPKKSQVCHSKALFNFVSDNFNYISDPIEKEYIENPYTFFISGGGDCESGTLFLASLMESIGINSELVFVPGHAFLRIQLPEASSRYKAEDDWIYLDWTNGKYGEYPNYEYMTYVDV